MALHHNQPFVHQLLKHGISLESTPPVLSSITTRVDMPLSYAGGTYAPTALALLLERHVSSWRHGKLTIDGHGRRLIVGT